MPVIWLCYIYLHICLFDSTTMYSLWKWAIYIHQCKCLHPSMANCANIYIHQCKCTLLWDVHRFVGCFDARAPRIRSGMLGAVVIVIISIIIIIIMNIMTIMPINDNMMIIIIIIIIITICLILLKSDKGFFTIPLSTDFFTIPVWQRVLYHPSLKGLLYYSSPTKDSLLFLVDERGTHGLSRTDARTDGRTDRGFPEFSNTTPHDHLGNLSVSGWCA